MRDKRASVVVFDDVDLTQEQFDQPILWLLAALLAFMPLAFGSWDAWQEEVALAGACGLALLLGIKLISRPDLRFAWSWTYLPIALFFLLIGFQMLPLPAAIVGAISPKTLSVSHAFLDDLPDAAQRLAHLSISFYHEGEWHDLRNLVTVTCVFVVVINVFRQPGQMIPLLWVIAIVGCAEGALAIAQTVSGAKAVYWYFPQWGDARPDSGSFPNHNCYAQFMNLSIGAMLCLLLYTIDQTFHRNDYTPAEAVQKLASATFRPAWILLAMIAISAASIFLSLSRGGMISIVAAGLVVGILLAIRGGKRGMGVGGWVVGVVLVAVFSMVMAGGANVVEARIARIGSSTDRFSRFELTKDTLRAWEDYPVIGTGLGSFRYTFPAYDHLNVSSVATHAEDEYAQLLYETGVVGGAIIAAFLVMMLANFLRARARGKRQQESPSVGEESEPLLARNPAFPADVEDDRAEAEASDVGVRQGSARRKSRSSRSSSSHRRRGKQLASPASSLSLGLCYGLVAILVHSTLDFGQHCISIASLTAISFALMVNLARFRRRERGLETDSPSVRGSVPLRVSATSLLVVAAAPLLWQANQVRLAFDAFKTAEKIRIQLAAADWQGDPGDFTDMNRAGDAAEQLRPGDIRFRYWRGIDRWYTISNVYNPVTGEVYLDDDKQKILRDAADDYQRARYQACALYGPLYSQLGQWDINFFNQPQAGASLVRKAFALAPGDPDVCFAMGTIDAEAGEWEKSVMDYRRAALLDVTMPDAAVDVYLGYFRNPDAALEFADHDVDWLRMVAAKIRAFGKNPAAGPTTGPATQPSDEKVALEAEQRADDIVRASADQRDAPAKLLGEMGLLCARKQDFAGAVKYLSRALTLDYGEQDWRLVYAQSLAAVGRSDDAVHQARIILRARPKMPEALALIDRLTKPSPEVMHELSQ